MQFEDLLREFTLAASLVVSVDELESLKIEYLGKKGILASLFSKMKDFSHVEKKSFGANLNKLRDQITTEIEAKQKHFRSVELNKKLSSEKLDMSEPERMERIGLLHPISITIRRTRELLEKMGFSQESGPEIDDDFHNFSALNFHESHPARQMHDTFYLENDMLLRTHTSNTQIRTMRGAQPPFKSFSIGKVFRRDSDQTHTPMFHQLEGFLVDEKANFAQLRWVVETFLRKFFEIDGLSIRFRPSFFPFTEPSAEVDIQYSRVTDNSYSSSCENESLPKQNLNDVKNLTTGAYMEVLGCGMIHPNVLINCGIDHKKYRGFAFGVGIERLAMLKYGIPDLRLMLEAI